jgi:ribosomal protein S12 methylthiotransferase accessory factor
MAAELRAVRVMSGSKMILTGTHRAVPAEETWDRIRPLLGRVGISRVADLTGLDVVGIPVFQAVRPNARTLSVSQGKGVTKALARVSGAMEAMELWHAEQPIAGGVDATVGEMTRDLPYCVFDLPLASRSILSEQSRLRWVRAQSLFGPRQTWLPEACVRLDSTQLAMHRPLFHCTSNGLASGNTMPEALLHALYELLEREAIVYAAQGGAERITDQATVCGVSRELLDRFECADVRVRIADMSQATGVPCYEAVIWSRALPHRFAGSGCHRDPDVALSRALTEAAQSRLTMIAGTRDDILDLTYELVESCPVLREPNFSASGHLTPFIGGSIASDTFDDDLAAVLAVVEKLTPAGAFWVNLTHPAVGVPVARVVAPGLRVPRAR